MKPLSIMASNLVKTVGSSGIQFLITLIATPIMTRLYDPSAYATFGILTNATATIVGIGFLSLPVAYVAEKESLLRREILQTLLSLLSILLLLTITLAIGLAVADVWHVGMDIPISALLLFPILILTYGIRQIMTNVAIRNTHFNSTSLARIIEPVCARGGAIGLGALWGGNPAFILVAAIFGHCATAATICTSFSKNTLQNWREHLQFSRAVMPILRRYSDFAIYNTLSNQAQSFALVAIQIAMVSFFSSEQTGYYILATSIVTLPTNLIALTTSAVVYRHMIDLAHTMPSKLGQYIIKAASIYLLSGICILLPVVFFGEFLFAFAFGAKWTEAGRIAAILSLAHMATFAAIGVQSVFSAIGRLRLQFWIELTTNIITIITTIIAFYMMTFTNAIYVLMGIMLLRNVIIIAASIWAALQHKDTANMV